MDRESLFRGKTYNDEWVYGSLITEEYITAVDENPLLHKKSLHYYIYTKDESDWTSRYMKIPVMAQTLGQFVGLCDKNGKKIFEGDIISDGSINTWTVKYGYTHIACCGCCYGYHDYIGFYFEDKYGEVDMYEEITKKIEVIGNIWDNRELLEKS